MTQQIQVLIIDDHDDSRIILGAILKHAGFVVSEAADGREGLALARELSPALVIIELRMRHLPGAQTLMLLRMDRNLERVPAIGVSGYDLADEARSSGFNAFLRKPIPIDVLLSEVRRLASPPLLA